MNLRPGHRRRSAFTLVEMLVASALIIFMMYIIASAFERGLELFRGLKVQGDMQDKLRAAATTIRLDLTAQHFGDGSALSDQRLNDQYWQPPLKGYFRISQSGIVGAQEGVDPDNPAAPYYRLTQQMAKDIYLQFTVNLTNGHPAIRDARARRDQFFMTRTDNENVLNPYSGPDYNADGSTLFTSYWAEVTYFAKPNGKVTDGNVPLFDVCRRQKLLVESPAPPPTATHPLPYPSPPTFVASGSYNDVSAWTVGSPPQTMANSSADVTEPLRRWGMSGVFGLPLIGSQTGAITPFQTILDEASTGVYAANPYADPLLGPRIGGDLLLTNVVSFDIKVLWEPVRKGGPNTDRFFANSQITTPYFPQDGIEPSAVNNLDYPFDYLPLGANTGLTQVVSPNQAPRIFDTWSSNTDRTVAQPIIYGVDSSAYANAVLPADPNYANWNAGHFAAAKPQPPTQPGTNIPLRIRVRAIQIKLRIWDQKTSQTRQMTIIQDM